MFNQLNFIISKINNQISFILTLGIFILFANKPLAQAKEFTTIWDYQIGSTTLEDIIQDEIGFIWIATQGGLIRFDGYGFVSYKHDPNNNTSIDDNLTRVLLPTKDHQLWVGTMTGVNLFDPKTDEFTRYNFLSNEAGNYLGVTSLVEFNNEILVGTENGLFFIEKTNKTIKPYSVKPVAHESYHSITQLLVSKNNLLWLSTKDTLYQLNSSQLEFEPVIKSEKDEIIVDLFEDLSGNIWVRWSTGVIHVLNPDNLKTPKMILKTNDVIAGYFPSWQAMIQPNENEIWIGTNTGVTIIDAQSGKTIIKQLKTDGTVKSLLFDQSGLVWAAIDGYGLGKYIPQNKINLFNQGLDLASVGAVCEIDNEIWIGTRGAGIYRLNRESNNLTHLDIASLTEPKNDGFIRDILYLNGSIWVATNFAGILQLDSSGKLIRHYNKANGLPSNQTFSLANDSNGFIWIGTLDNGLAIIHPQNDEIQHIPISEFTTPILDIVITLKDTTYLATPSGLVKISTNGNITTYNTDKVVDHSIPSNFIVNLMIDSKQNLWLGTRDGLAVLKGDIDTNSNPKFTKVTSENGLLDSFIDGILEGINNDIWIALGSELIQYNLENSSLFRFSVSDGIPQGGYWVGSHQSLQNKTMMFATKEGVLFVNPEAKSWNYHPKTIITQINNGGRISRNPMINTLSIEADKNFFSLEFAALDYSSPEKNKYSYKLIGFDKDWIEVDALHRIATYTNLDPGSYQFQLKGTNRNHNWSDYETNIHIAVQPAFHETIWFKIISSIAVFALLYLLFLWRMHRINAKQAKLEKLIKIRTKDLEISNAKLKQSSKTDYLTSLPNRNGFFEIAETQLRINKNSTFSIAIADIDNFKSFNDNYGHHFGDHVLKEFSNFLKNSVRDIDLVARWGGEEFTILFPAADVNSAQVLCQNVIDHLKNKNWAHEGVEFKIMITIGVCQMQSDMSLDDCIRIADNALYQGKRDGKGKVVPA